MIHWRRGHSTRSVHPAHKECNEVVTWKRSRNLESSRRTDLSGRSKTNLSFKGVKNGQITFV